MEQQRSQKGDKHESANNFLYVPIPHLTRVVFQDAPYWLKYFPRSTWSRFLSNLLPVHSFREWCEAAIVKASEINDMRAFNTVETLNTAAM